MTNNKFPNFLIVGMAKCGTTSFSQYLQQHPQIFISKKKEPRYITSQCTKLPLGGPKDHQVENWYVKNLHDYLALFEGADEKAIGEASADTMYFYEKTIPFIKNNFPEPKIIIILRNPVKRAFSAYQHLVRDEREELSFEQGLEEEPNRIKANFELIYYYRNAGLYYEPVNAFLDNFKNVKVILNDNLISRPQETLSEVFEFLNVNKNFSVDVSVKYNISGIAKNRFLNRNLQNDTLLRKSIRPFTRVLLPSKNLRSRFASWMASKNMTRITIHPNTKNELIDYFKNDIERTGKLLKKDLSHWLVS